MGQYDVTSSPRARFQIAAFQAHYKIGRRAGLSPEMSLASTIVATSDEATSKAIRKRPTAINEWLQTSVWGRRTMKNAKNNHNNQ